MAVTQCIPNSAINDLLTAQRDWSADTFKMALYTQAGASLDASSTVYTTTGEVTGTGYAAGGQALTGTAIAFSGNTLYVDWNDPSWASSTITADAAAIYNSSNGNRLIALLTFPSQSSSGTTFTVVLPAAGVSAVITIRNA